MASILAVDDEVGILDMIQSILSKDGHSVTGITKKIRATPYKCHNSHYTIGSE